MERFPAWLEVRSPIPVPDPSLARLDAGERDAILPTRESAADVLLVDELRGRREAERQKIPVIGTVGILREAAEFGLLDLRNAFARLLQTSFHISEAVLSALIPK